MAVRVPSRPVSTHLREFGELTAFSAGALVALPSTARYASEVLRQTSILIRGSTLFIAAMTLAIGFSTTNYGYYFLKAAGAADYVGLVPGVTTPRVLAVLLFGYAFAAKVGCGLTSEIGAMKTNEELDGYESEGVSVQRFVVGTRVAAALIYAPIAMSVAMVAATLGAYVNAVLVIEAVPAETFFRYNWGNQALGDQFFALVCAFILSAVMVLVACFYGTRSTGGPAGVGRAVSRSLVVNLVLIHVILGLAVFAVYGKNLGLPIGG